MAMKPGDASIRSNSQEPRPFTELTLSVEFARARDYRSIERPIESQSVAQIQSEPARDPEEQQDVATKSNRCRYYQKGSFVEHLIYYCALSVASYAGVLSRIYLANLKAWNGVQLFPSFSAELVGTAIMGFITSHKKLLDSHKAVYQAIATGLCGSITTFSSWNSEAIEVLLQIGRAPPNNSERIIGWVTVLIIGLGMPIAALLFGQHVAHLSPWSDNRLVDGEEFVHSRKRYRIAERVVIVLAWVCSSCLVVYVPLHFKQYDIVFSCVFCFVGTYIRWHLAPLNALIPNFKLGTFIVNVLGAWVLGAVAVVMTHYETELEEVTMAVLTGVGTGFCGCLTTVSTFAVELSTLSLTGSYVYGFLSLALAQLGLVAIRGTYTWTR